MIYACMGKKAAQPYYIEQICLNIYTFEELLYFLKGNAYLLDETIVNSSLIRFIGEDLGLDKLGEELKSLWRKNKGVADITCAIFAYGHYLSEEDLEKSRRIIEGNSDVRPYMRIKSRGDFFYLNKSYAAAGEEYLRCVEECDDEAVLADICHSLAMIYLRSFLFEQAGEYLKKEWEITKEDNTLKEYLMTLKLGAGKDIYEQEIMELDPDPGIIKMAEEAVEEAENAAKEKVGSVKTLQNGDRIAFIRKNDEIVNSLKSEYRREF